MISRGVENTKALQARIVELNRECDRLNAMNEQFADELNELTDKQEKKSDEKIINISISINGIEQLRG